MFTCNLAVTPLRLCAQAPVKHKLPHALHPLPLNRTSPCRNSQNDRNEELFERAAQLRDRQRKLEEELKELQNEFGELSEEGRASLLEALGLPPQPSQDAFKNDLEGLPPIIKRSLEQAGAWDPFLASQAARASSGKVSLDVDQAQCQADAEFMDGDEEEFEIGEGVEEYARLIEGGKRPPPVPPGDLLREAETLEEFRGRIQASIESYERSMGWDRGLGRSGAAGLQGWREAAEQGGTAAQGDEPRLKEEPAGSPDEGSREWAEQSQDDVIIPEEIEGTIPAPEPPAHIMEQYYRMEQILYVLRRGFLEKKPTAWIQSLVSKNLVSQDMFFADPWVGLGGPQEVQRYMRQLEASGATFELSKAMARCMEYDPLPHWQLIVDLHLHLPLPDWYLQFLWLHPEYHALWEGYTTVREQQGAQHGGQQAGRNLQPAQQAQHGGWVDWGADAGRRARQYEYTAQGLAEEGDMLVGLPEHGQRPGRLYPRVPISPQKGDGSGEGERASSCPGRAFLSWVGDEDELRQGSPGDTTEDALQHGQRGMGRQPPHVVWVPNPLTQLALEAWRRELRERLAAASGSSVGEGQEGRGSLGHASGWWADDAGLDLCPEESGAAAEGDGDGGRHPSAWWEGLTPEEMEQSQDLEAQMAIVCCPEGVRAELHSRFQHLRLRARQVDSAWTRQQRYRPSTRGTAPPPSTLDGVSPQAPNQVRGGRASSSSPASGSAATTGSAPLPGQRPVAGARGTGQEGSSGSSRGEGWLPEGQSGGAACQREYQPLRPWLLLEEDWAGEVASALYGEAGVQETAATGTAGTAGGGLGGVEIAERAQEGDGGRRSRVGLEEGDKGEGIGIAYEPAPDQKLTKPQAEYILRGLLGDDFDSVMAQMPSRERRTGKETTQVGPGEAFKEGRCLTVTLTLAVELDTEKGEVVSVGSTWGSVRSVLGSARDAYEIYAAQAGLHPLPPGRHALRDLWAGVTP